MTDIMLYFVNQIFFFMIKKTRFIDTFKRGQMRGSSILRGIWNELNIHGVPQSG